MGSGEIAAWQSRGGLLILRKDIFASLAQLVEQLICNQQVAGSTPAAGSIDVQ